MVPPGVESFVVSETQETGGQKLFVLLLWLNQAAAKVYKRYNPIKLSYPAVWYNQHEDWEEIKAAGLKAVMEAQAHIEPRFLTIEDYLEQLGVYDIDELPNSEVEIVTELVCYMIKVNAAVAQEQNRAWKSFGTSREFSEQAEKEAYLDSLKETWKYQDMLSRGNLTPKDMESFFELYQI